MLDLHICPLGIATLSLDRPQAMNAMDADMIAGLLNAVAAVKTNPSARVLLLTGRGRAFCAGADLRDPMMGLELSPAERGAHFLAAADASINALARALHGLGKPKIAAVNGPAVGGGSALALACDIVIAGRSAYFQFPFTAQLGLVPDLGASWHLMRRLGAGRAVPAAMLGERISAQQAQDWGLIWRCVEDGALMHDAHLTAERLAQGAPRALARLQHVMSAALHNDFSQQLDCERDSQAALVQTQDFVEAVTAFREKRKPQFSGS